MSTDIFESSVRATGDFAGVFEYDGDTGYFYLYEVGGNADKRIVASIHLLSRQPDFAESDVTVRWNRSEERVGLLIRGVLWAVFDAERRLKYGGRYEVGAKPSLPLEAMSGFDVG